MGRLQRRYILVSFLCRLGGTKRRRSYPFLPITPMAALNLRVKYPSLPPKQNHRPYYNQKVRETRKTAQGQVPAQLVRHLEQEGQRRPLPSRVPETMQRLHLAPQETHEVAHGVLVFEVRIVLAKAGRGVGCIAGRGGRAAIAAAGVASHDTASIGGRRCAVRSGRCWDGCPDGRLGRLRSCGLWRRCWWP